MSRTKSEKQADNTDNNVSDPRLPSESVNTIIKKHYPNCIAAASNNHMYIVDYALLQDSVYLKLMSILVDYVKILSGKTLLDVAEVENIDKICEHFQGFLEKTVETYQFKKLYQIKTESISDKELLRQVN
jgi:hypothetical protein